MGLVVLRTLEGILHTSAVDANGCFSNAQHGFVLRWCFCSGVRDFRSFIQFITDFLRLTAWTLR